MDIGKFIDSLNIVKPYVDNLITFSVHRWSTAFASDRELGVNRSYYDAYKRYVTTGERSASKTDGHYVHIRPAQGQTLTFNPYANAGLTDGWRETAATGASIRVSPLPATSRSSWKSDSTIRRSSPESPPGSWKTAAPPSLCRDR